MTIIDETPWTDERKMRARREAWALIEPLHSEFLQGGMSTQVLAQKTFEIWHTVEVLQIRAYDDVTGDPIYEMNPLVGDSFEWIVLMNLQPTRS